MYKIHFKSSSKDSMLTNQSKPVKTFNIDFKDDDSLSIISCETNSDVAESPKQNKVKKNFQSLDKNQYNQLDKLQHRKGGLDREKTNLSSLLTFNGKANFNGRSKDTSPKQFINYERYRIQKPLIKSINKVENIKDNFKAEQELNVRLNMYLDKHRESK